MINTIQIRPIEIDIDINFNSKLTSRYITPPACTEIEERYLKYRNAKKLANDIKIDKGIRHCVIIDGTFVFGDFIEALIVKNNYLIKRMIISTLSMNQNNVDSLYNLLNGGYVEKLDLIISDHFYSHEKGDLIPYIYNQLDIDNKFQLAAAGTHCKICMFETECGKFVVIHGSANLRSSSNIEQFVVEENKGIYDFYLQVQHSIIEKYKTINHEIKSIYKRKSLRSKKLWQAVAMEVTKDNA